MGNAQLPLLVTAEITLVVEITVGADVAEQPVAVLVTVTAYEPYAVGI